MKAIIVAASVVLGVASTGAQGLLREEIATAIEQGRAGKTLQKKCGAYGDNGFDIVVEGPVGRIMRAAREAKGQQREFTTGDVTPVLAGPVLTVVARRHPGLRASYGEYVSPGFAVDNSVYQTDVVLKSKPSGSDEPILLRPTGPILYDRKNAPGYRSVVRGSANGYLADGPRYGPFPGSDMIASFDLAAFKAIPHRDVEVVIFMTDTGERRCKISEKERRALR